MEKTKTILKINANLEGILLDMADDNFNHTINRKQLKEVGLKSVNDDMENIWKQLLNSKIKTNDICKAALANAKKIAMKLYETINLDFSEVEWSNIQALFAIRVSTPKSVGEKTFVYSSMGVFKKNLCRYLYQIHVAGNAFVTYVKESDEKRMNPKKITKKGVTVMDVTSYIESLDETSRAEFIKKFIVA